MPDEFAFGQERQTVQALYQHSLQQFNQVWHKPLTSHPKTFQIKSKKIKSPRSPQFQTITPTSLQIAPPQLVQLDSQSLISLQPRKNSSRGKSLIKQRLAFCTRKQQKSNLLKQNNFLQGMGRGRSGMRRLFLHRLAQNEIKALDMIICNQTKLSFKFR